MLIKQAHPAAAPVLDPPKYTNFKGSSNMYEESEHITLYFNTDITFMCSAVLAHFILKERLHMFGIVGCLLCVVGSVTIVLHAPLEKSIQSVKDVWYLATAPGIFKLIASYILPLFAEASLGRVLPVQLNRSLLVWTTTLCTTTPQS